MSMHPVSYDFIRITYERQLAEAAARRRQSDAGTPPANPVRVRIGAAIVRFGHAVAGRPASQPAEQGRILPFPGSAPTS